MTDDASNPAPATDPEPEPDPGPRPPHPPRPASVAGTDVFRSGRKPLDAIFAPRCVAVVGATEKPGGVGRNLLLNLVQSPFGGTVYPVNPHRPNVLGIRAYRSIAEVPEPVDLAILATPAATVPGLIAECGAAGVGGAIVISSGFREGGDEGAALEAAALEEARRGRVRLVGPSCLGVMLPWTGLNASVAGPMARPGQVGFISQSGALTSAILDWSFRSKVGFSAFVSVGSMLDVGWGDLIDYLGDDPRTRSIVMYMEAVGDARAFLSAAREVALTKPIIVIKAGRADPSARTSASDAGALVGSDEVLEAAFRRGGVLRVDTIADVFALADVLGKQPRPRGPRLAIVTNAGGPGALAADALAGQGGRLADLSAGTVARLDASLPGRWGGRNPVDVTGEADPARFAAAVEAVADDPNVDGLLAILAPRGAADPTLTADLIRPMARLKAGKPILASWMGSAEVLGGEAILNDAGIPNFPYPDTAARVFTAMARHDDNLRAMYETPTLPPESGRDADDRLGGDRIVDRALAEGRTSLDDFESKALLRAHGLPAVETVRAWTEDDAVGAAEAVGYPVAVGPLGRAADRHPEAGAVRAGLADESAVRDAFRGIVATASEMAGRPSDVGVTVRPTARTGGFELIVGGASDPQFGPVLLFGAGGKLVEVYRDRSLALPPLTSTLARRLMERTRIFEALRGPIGTKRPPADLDALERFLVRFSQMLVERPRIKEVDVRPLVASADGVLALEARVTLHDPGLPDHELPRPAIRPYPRQYVGQWAAKDGGPVTIRPIRAEDEPLLVKFHETLSERSVALRYFQALKLSQRVAHDRLTRICFNDYDRELALVVDRKEPWTDAHEILGVGRLSKTRGTAEAEFALLINDQHQGRGFGTELLRRLLGVARDEKIARVSAEILADNLDMRRVAEKLGFRIDGGLGDNVLRATIDVASIPAGLLEVDDDSSPGDMPADPRKKGDPPSSPS